MNVNAEEKQKSLFFFFFFENFKYCHNDVLNWILERREINLAIKHFIYFDWIDLNQKKKKTALVAMYYEK